MFGYVLPRRDRLSEAEQERYRAAYCGLCRCLKKRYGFRARFLVNYDMTFLYFLLGGGEGRQPERCFCPARVLCRKDCMPRDAAMDYAADLSVLLSYWKLRDAKQDGRPLAAGAGLLLYRRAYRRAAARQPVCDRVFSERLAALHKLETEGCDSLDRPADAFASLLRACAEFVPEGARRRTLELLLYHVGRYLYLTDALEDLPKDLRRGSYNPLAHRYRLEDGKLTETDRAALLDTIGASLRTAASAFELLPAAQDRELIQNIIYEGLPTVLRCVAAGTFRKRGKTNERPV